MMTDHNPFTRVYSNALSSQSYTDYSTFNYCGNRGSVEADARQPAFQSYDQTEDGWLKLPMRGPDQSAGCDPFGMHAALIMEPLGNFDFSCVSPRGPSTDSELFPMSSSALSGELLEPVVVLPPESNLHTALEVPEATAHMTMSNGFDDTSCHDVRQEDKKMTSCSCCIDARASRPNALGAPPKLQGVTVAYMEDTGRLDLTLERAAQSLNRAAQSLNVSPTIMKAHLRYLGVSKWPSRKRSTLHRLLRHAPDLQGHPRRKVDSLGRTVGELRSTLESELKNVHGPTPMSMKVLIKDLRQRWYKSREYRRRQQRQQTPPFGTQTPAQTIPPRPQELEACSVGWQIPEFMAL